MAAQGDPSMPETARRPFASPPPLEVDPVTGHMTLWDVPVWLLSPQYYAEMQVELETLSGKASKGVLYRVAFRSGRRAVEALGLACPAETPDAECAARLRRLEDIALAAGHGFSEISTGDLAKREVTWIIEHSLLATLHARSAEPVCHYYEGFLAGFVTTVLGAPVEGREMECRAKGDAHCVFHTKTTGTAPF